MTRGRLVGAILTALIVALGAYIATNTEWVDVPVPTPPKGEALTNPFYAAQRFTEALGATARREVRLTLPSTRGVVVLSAWHWDLSPERQQTLRQWVEAGGRLVVDNMLSGNLQDFESWNGIEQHYDEEAAEHFYDNYDASRPPPECTNVTEVASQHTYLMCHLDFSFLRVRGEPQWALRNDLGYQVVRVNAGLGSVTVVNAMPFTHRELFHGEHAQLFVAATQLRRGDEVIFLSEQNHPPLLTLMWRYASPAIVLSLAAIGLVLWRGAVRLGPAVPTPEHGRRSMAEQIRGTGRFVLKHGDGSPLHVAAVRALAEAARRRVPAYARLSRKQRAGALGKITGLDGDAIMSAVEDVSKRRPAELRTTLGLLEISRRQLLTQGRNDQR
jgi:hypothetical protein